MPFEVSNPVKFYAGGDTTSQAIGKHIAEIARIYDILNDGLDSAKSVVVVLSPNTVLKDEQLGITPAPLEIKRGNGVQRWSELPDGIRLAQAIDNLTSDDWVAPLSARQGKLLKELIDTIPKTEVVDDLTTGGSGKALSAEQGKALKSLIDALTTPVPGPPGPKGIEWRGAWDGAVAYRKDDAVSYRGGSYIALKPSTGEPPTNAEFWGVLSAKGADGAGSGDMTKAVYDPDGDGKVSSAVAADHAGTADTATRAGTADAVAWDNVTGKPTSFKTEIVDSLDSDKTDAALSAAQGKALKGLIDTIPKTEVIDSLDSNKADAALSARQGKSLKALIDAGGSGGGGGNATISKVIDAITTGNWTDQKIAQGDWGNVIWVPELNTFITCNVNHTATSNNGRIWISSTVGAPNSRVVGWSPKFKMLCMIGKDKAATSTTLNVWTQVPIASSNPGVIRSICWSPGLDLFCGVGDGGRVVLFQSGTTWSEYTVPNADMTKVCWCPELGLLCAVGRGGKILTSPDGKTWTTHISTSVDLSGCCWAKELKLFCAVGANKVITSTDLTTWVEHTVKVDSLSGICWSPEVGLFCAVSSKDDSTHSYGMSSPDGVGWTVRRLSAGVWADICWSRELGMFCAVGVNKVITSFPLPL